MPGISKSRLHEVVLSALGGEVTTHTQTERVPLVVTTHSLGQLAVYAFTLTSPPGGRPLGEFKTQLIVPGQNRRERAALACPAGAFTTIVGWSPEETLFVLWDAYAHQDFAYSQNLQVGGRAVWLAKTEGIAHCLRRLRGARGTETVIVCVPTRLVDGLRERMRFSAERLMDRQ